MIKRLRHAADNALYWSIYIIGPWLYIPVNVATRFYSWLNEKQLFRSFLRHTERLHAACTGRSTTDKLWSQARLAEAYDVAEEEVERLDLKPYDKKYPAQLARDKLGNIFVFWCFRKKGTGNYTLYAKNYSPELGWSKVRQVAVETGHARIVMITINPQGNAHGIWQHSRANKQADTPHFYNISGSHYNAITGWSNAQLISSNTEASPAFQMAFDGNNNALAVWEQPMGTIPEDDTMASNIWSSRFIAGDGWGKSVSLEPGTQLTESRDPIITCNKQGGATVVWRQEAYGQDSFWINRFNEANGWATAEMFLPDTHGEAHSRAALDEEGNAIMVWLQRERNGNYTVWARHFNVESGWNDAERISRKSENASFEVPQVMIDKRGNALAVWSSLSHYSKISANYYTAGKGWGYATRISNIDTASSTDNPEISLNLNGDFKIVWQQSLHNSTNKHIWVRQLE